MRGGRMDAKNGVSAVGNAVSVVVCSGDQAWRQRVVSALQTGDFQVLDLGRDPDQTDLNAHREHHPPDVVVWHVGSCAAISDLRYEHLCEWAPGTRFVVVNAAGRELPTVCRKGYPPVPFACLPAETSDSAIALGAGVAFHCG
jgi:hypothetical protein